MELGKVAAHKGASSTQETRRAAAGKRRMHGGGAREKEHQKGCQKVKTWLKTGKARHP